jgi:hypothetical protein
MRVSLCYELISSAERNKRDRERETSERHVGEAHSVLTTAILLPQRLSCYPDKIVSLRMLTNLRLVDLRLTTAQQKSTGQNLPSVLYQSERSCDVFSYRHFHYVFKMRQSTSIIFSFFRRENCNFEFDVCLKWIKKTNSQASDPIMAKRKFLTLPGPELRPICRPARSQSLYRLRYRGSWCVLCEH